MSAVIQAVVFDVDGTLLDSREYITGAYLHALKHHGVEGNTIADIASLIGLPIDECYRRLAPGVDTKSLRDAHREFHRTNPAMLLVYPHAAKILKMLKAQGLKLAVFTSHGPTIVEKIKGFELDHFDAYVHSDSVTRHKPHPEGFLNAAAQMNVNPDRAVMIGDSWVDIQAGKDGGALATIGVSHGFGTIEQLEEAGPDYIIDGLDKVPDVITKLEKIHGKTTHHS